MVYFSNPFLRKCVTVRILLLPHGLEDGGHLLTLPLSPDVGSDALLKELQAPLVLGDLQQLHGAPLVGGEADDLTDQVADGLAVLGDLALGLDGGGGGFDLGGLLALIHAHDHFVAGSHLDGVDQSLAATKGIYIVKIADGLVMKSFNVDGAH